jgi:hypothetical protein
MKSFANLTSSDPRSSQTRRLLSGAVLVVALLLLATVFFIFDPSRHGFYPSCQFHKLTGLNCPGCGGLRALHHLTHGDFLAAFRCNPLFITLLPIIGFLSFRWFKHGRSAFETRSIFFRPVTLWMLLAVTLVFTILRNLPWPAFAWMSP